MPPAWLHKRAMASLGKHVRHASKSNKVQVKKARASRDTASELYKNKRPWKLGDYTSPPERRPGKYRLYRAIDFMALGHFISVAPRSQSLTHRPELGVLCARLLLQVLYLLLSLRKQDSKSA